MIDVGGVGYLVQCSGRTLDALGPIGGEVLILTELQVREDAWTLFGFGSTAERDAFRALTSVQGVGGKVALAILSALSPDELDPQLEGDLRLVDSETGEGIDVTVDLATIDQYKARLAAWQESFADLCAKRRASYLPMSTDLPLADLVFAELRRRRVVG